MVYSYSRGLLGKPCCRGQEIKHNITKTSQDNKLYYFNTQLANYNSVQGHRMEIVRS